MNLCFNNELSQIITLIKYIYIIISFTLLVLGYLLLFTELTLVDIFTIVGSIATTLSAFAALWTLLEVKKQREQSNMPDIILWPEKRFYVFRQGNGESIQYQHWNETNILDEKAIETIGNYEFTID
jgi:hypothetical protein